MAAYAALVSLMNLIEDIDHHHSPPISLHKHQIQSLTEYVMFLQEFLHAYKSPVSDRDEADPLEMRIADAAYAAEDAIESCIADNVLFRRPITDIVDKIRPIRSMVNAIRPIRSVVKAIRPIRSVVKAIRPIRSMVNVAVAGDFIESHISNEIHLNRSKATKIGRIKPHALSEGVQSVIEEMDRIKIVAMGTNTEKVVVQRDQPCRFASSSNGKKSSGVMVFSNHVIHGIMEKLVADERSRQVIPITRMGGIGKTALAQTVYSHKAIIEHFDICAWATISEQYNMREILCELVHQATKENKEQLSERSEHELGLELHQHLSGRRFLIVMDDIWNIESWDKIQRFFPNNENHSRIMVTTRLSQLSSQLNNQYSHQMEFLDESSSWVLFSKTVFGEEQFPLELEKVGKEIANNCRGLPLSIVVVGGILKNMELTQECWESIKKNLTSIVSSENDKHCLRLLKMSYNHLPVYLKPCLLYMGVFEEDEAISVSTLIKLWVSEGFLKPIDGKSLETIGKELLKDLVDRNLVLVDRLGCTGKIKRVKVHDLVRYLSLNQGKKEGFYHVMGESDPRHIDSHRRIVICRRKKVDDDLQYMSNARSIICEHGKVPSCWNNGLLRTVHAYKSRTFKYEIYMSYHVNGYVNLRHLAVQVASMSSIIASFHHCWNLQTLIVSCQHESTVPTEIWKLSQLRHIEMTGILPDPPCDVGVMEKLEVLKGALNFKCSEEMAKRIPNIKKLKIRYSRGNEMCNDDYYCLRNIKCLCKLESLDISCEYGFVGNASLYKLAFPQTLKSLTLAMEGDFEWEMVLEKIGSLPLLEKFQFWRGCFGTGKWEIVEGQFSRLKYLGLFSCPSLKHWTTEASSIFPRLEKLRISHLEGLETILHEIGYIPTLQEIWMFDCSESLVVSAKEIVEEQMDLQGDELPFHVHVSLPRAEDDAMKESMQSMTGPNFKVV